MVPFCTKAMTTGTKVFTAATVCSQKAVGVVRCLEVPHRSFDFTRFSILDVKRCSLFIAFPRAKLSFDFDEDDGSQPGKCLAATGCPCSLQYNRNFRHAQVCTAIGDKHDRVRRIGRDVRLDRRGFGCSVGDAPVVHMPREGVQLERRPLRRERQLAQRSTHE